MAVKRIVDTSFWTDKKVMEVFSPEDKLFMLYIMTNPHTTQLGIYEINTKYMALELGFSNDVINVLLDRFETKYDILKYSKKTSEIAIKNFLKHSIIKGGKPVEDCLIRDIKLVHDDELLEYIYNHLICMDKLNITVKKILPYLINNNENVNENENDVSSTYRGTIRDGKSIYGEYSHVLLKDEELLKLNDEYGEEFTLLLIKELDEAIEMKGYKYKSHYLVIKKWVVDAVKKKGFKPKQEQRKEEVYEPINREEHDINF